MVSPILIVSAKIGAADLEQFRENPFGTMIKFVVDVERGLLALGGEMHADAEQVLLESESRQEHLWGGNLWPWGDRPHIEYISLINIRPSVGNRGMEIGSEDVRRSVERIVKTWIDLPW